MVNVQYFLVLFLFSLIIFSCNRDTVVEINCDTIENPVYDGNIAALIDATCAHSGIQCHGSGSGLGDYSTYENFINSDNREFIQRVSEITGAIRMPPGYSIGGPTTLTDFERLTLICWAQDDFPEN